MKTELYAILEDLLLKSGLSKRGFAEKNGLSHAWFIEFMSSKRKFRPLQAKTMSILMHNFGIPIEVLKDYNNWVIEERRK